MAKRMYRKRSIVVEAEQYIPTDDPREAPLGVCWQTYKGYHSDPHIHTLEGPLAVSPRDYVVTGIEGEQYPVKEDIFLRTYDPVDGGHHAS